jgi:tetratricopeptide (TPR) repeat protein
VARRIEWFLAGGLALALATSVTVAQPVRDATQLFADGFDELQANQPERAIKDLAAGLQLEPDNAMAQFTLGEAYQRAGRPGEAADAWRQVLRISPEGRVADRARARLATLTPSTTAEPGRAPAATASGTGSAPLPPLIARYGLNTLPGRPRLVRPEPVDIPASFCSEADRNAFHSQRYEPQNRQALDNNEQAKRYLDLLNEMHAEYNQLDSGYANVVTREFKDFEPIMQEVHADSDAYYRLHDAIMRTPITPCPATP